jgi:hypothetical protein
MHQSKADPAAQSGVRLIPRLRDLPSRRLYLFDPASEPNELRSLIGGKIREGLAVENWLGVLRCSATMVTGVMPPSQARVICGEMRGAKALCRFSRPRPCGAGGVSVADAPGPYKDISHDRARACPGFRHLEF